MSAFLGPIHHWLFRKIQFQNELTNRIIDIYDKQNIDLQLATKLNEQYGRLEQQPLAEIIDEANIHGWLQERVSVVEYRLADLVTTLLKHDQNNLTAIEQICIEFGREHKAVDTDNAPELFQYFDDLLLDGMPCDHANEVTERLYDEVIWQRNICVHQQYWDETGGDANNYYLLRDALIKGMLDGSSFIYEKLEDNTYTLRRRT